MCVSLIGGVISSVMIQCVYVLRVSNGVLPINVYVAMATIMCEEEREGRTACYTLYIRS